ncbi:metallophosphoesterase [Holophaga foetida]|uniref:metallophosphoesterase n=1 Tax=Holophaga foetida TaxID=35839 RepID=UPI0002471838|nr:metallophosphoesterase [Holophaga foetida]
MAFFFLILGIGLQVLHWRALRRILPPKWSPWLAAALVLIHVPLLTYVVLRLTGASSMEMGYALRPLARGGLYFVALSTFNLLLLSLEALLWRIRKHRGRDLDHDRRAFLQKGAIVSLGVLGLLTAKGYREGHGEPEVRRKELFFPDLPPAFDGLRIAHLSDLHSGPLVRRDQLRLWRAMAEREHPDLLLITGDLVDALPEEVEPIIQAFRDFPASMGRFAILGNHDYFTDPRPLWAGMEGIGFTFLENRHQVLSRGADQLVIFGLQDPMARNGRFRGLRFGPGPMPQDTALLMPRDGWRLALVHRPSNWNLALEAGARLTLSGHTHGGQINLVPGVSSAYIQGRFTRGIYHEGPHQMNVSAGLGMVGLPVRLASPPEFSLLTLRRGGTQQSQ